MSTGHSEGEYNCGACSSSEVQRLLCELLDADLSAAREAAIRSRLTECAECNRRLQTEELIRTLVHGCDAGIQAPDRLREHISVQIRMTRTTRTTRTQYGY